MIQDESGSRKHTGSTMTSTWSATYDVDSLSFSFDDMEKSLTTSIFSSAYFEYLPRILAEQVLSSPNISTRDFVMKVIRAPQACADPQGLLETPFIISYLGVK